MPPPTQHTIFIPILSFFTFSSILSWCFNIRLFNVDFYQQPLSFREARSVAWLGDRASPVQPIPPSYDQSIYTPSIRFTRIFCLRWTTYMNFTACLTIEALR